MRPISQTTHRGNRLSITPLIVAFIALFAFMPASAMAAATTFYVNPAGSDANSGMSVATPFGTIQRAIDLAQPGDVISMAAGEYFQDIVSRRDGTADAPITLIGPPNAVIHGTGSPHIV